MKAMGALVAAKRKDAAISDRFGSYEGEKEQERNSRSSSASRFEKMSLSEAALR